MRPIRTSYAQDLTLLPTTGSRVRVALVTGVALAIPAFAGEFYLGELAAVFIFAIAGVGMMLLSGYTGLVSLGQAAFLGIGAYTNAVLLARGVPLILSLPSGAMLAGLAGVAIGIPTLRMSGLYLAIATLAFGSIVGTIFQKWEGVTGGFGGFPVVSPTLGPLILDSPRGLYFLSLAMLGLVLLVAANILRSPLGRSLVAIHGSEISAQSMGVNLAVTKTLSFAISAAITGLAGGLFAHYVHFLAPDSFDLVLSIQFVTMIVVGGLGSLSGAIYGAIFIRLLPQGIALLRDDLPLGIGHMPGLEPSLFGLILVLFIIFEPQGVAGRLSKIAHYWSAFPLHRRATFQRQKSYTRSERVR